jgi:Na+/H+-dicarboxylate symporter
MKRFVTAMIALTLASVALPAFAGGPVPITTAAAARLQLRARGLADIRDLWHIGDYWESEVAVAGKPMVAYLFDNGTLWLRRYPRAEMRQAFGGPAARSGRS